MRPLFACLSLTLALGLVPSSQADENAVVWSARATDSGLVASLRGQTLAAYQSTPYPQKPYLKQLFTPGGQQVLLDSPADHVHHHGLMFAISVDDISYWEEGDRGGRQNVIQTQTDDHGMLSQTLRWIDPQGAVALHEQRRIQLAQTADTTWLTWQSTLTVPETLESVRLGGGHYYGLGMRFIRAFDQVATFQFAGAAEGEPVRGTEKLTRASWVACRGKVDERWVTCAMFSSPDNTRPPAWWFTMDKPFAYQSATLNLWKQPLILERHDALQLTYGVALIDGDIPAEQVETLYLQWVASLSDELQSPPSLRNSK
ncbi:MAG: PmoA family protein [Pirellulaceae bacterium]|nr:PmoA family protein [Pirellulaceae bacterium]